MNNEQVKQIIEEILYDEYAMKRLKPRSRIEHVKNQIFFKIDNLDYQRKVLTNE